MHLNLHTKGAVRELIHMRKSFKKPIQSMLIYSWNYPSALRWHNSNYFLLNFKKSSSSLPLHHCRCKKKKKKSKAVISITPIYWIIFPPTNLNREHFDLKIPKRKQGEEKNYNICVCAWPREGEREIRKEREREREEMRTTGWRADDGRRRVKNRSRSSALGLRSRGAVRDFGMMPLRLG